MLGLGRFLSSDPAKRSVERAWLWYTPLWGGVSGVVLASGLPERWGDVECMIYGLLLALGAVLGPIVLRPPEDRQGPVLRSTAFKMALSVVGLSFGLNYGQTPFFFDVLHMHYGFHTRWNIQNNPFFLYLVSVAYYSTYSVLCMWSFRALRHALAFSRVLAASAYVVAPLAMAFLETVTNINPYTKSLYCYDDLPLMLSFGTVCYGAAFVFALPMWLAIDEPRRVSPVIVLVWCLAALQAHRLTLDVLRAHVAPHLTQVKTGANGLGDFGTSCLVAPTP
jgi:cycloeucalenol cycloisomerase